MIVKTVKISQVKKANTARALIVLAGLPIAQPVYFWHSAYSEARWS